MCLWLLLCLGSAAVASAANERSGKTTDSAAQDAFVAGKAVIIMRHSLAPGVGDPAGFRLDDCTTQRNLSDTGRSYSVRTGAMLRQWMQDDEPIDVFTSAWCRCRDTADLLGVGPVVPLPALNSFFVERGKQAARTTALERWILDRLATPDASPAVLVTHQVNITALTGEFASSGDMLFLSVEDVPDAGEDADNRLSSGLRVLATQAVPQDH